MKSMPIGTELARPFMPTKDFELSKRFYEALGFVLRYGGPQASFTSYIVGSGYLNLELKPNFTLREGWGRTIFYVTDVDAIYERSVAAGLDLRRCLARPGGALHAGQPAGQFPRLAELERRFPVPRPA